MTTRLTGAGITRFTRTQVKKLFGIAKRVIYTPSLDIRLGPQQQETGRILIVTSRKVGSAVLRNLIRRRIRSIFYEEKLYTQPYDCIVIVRPSATNLSFAQLKDILLRVYAAKAAEQTVY